MLKYFKQTFGDVTLWTRETDTTITVIGYHPGHEFSIDKIERTPMYETDEADVEISESTFFDETTDAYKAALNLL